MEYFSRTSGPRGSASFVLARAPGGRRSTGMARKTVAVCIAGESRTFDYPDVKRNIHRSMVAPLGTAVDVFFAVKESRPGEVYDASTFKLFDPVRTFSRHEQKRNELVSATTVHTPCLDMIQAQEQLQQYEYAWVLRLRTDVVYDVQLAPLPWKLPISATPDAPSEPIVLVECCGLCQPGSEDPLRQQCGPAAACKEPIAPGECTPTRCARLNWCFSWCVKDTWALMTRRAANVYFNRTALEKTDGCQGQYYECGLGCALHSHGVLVYKVALPRMIIRLRQPFMFNQSDYRPNARNHIIARSIVDTLSPAVLRGGYS